VFDLNGRLLNRVEYGPEWDRNYDGTRGSITISDGKLYFISGHGVLYCFDQNTLNLVWKKNLLKEFNAPNIVWGITESPLIVGNKVIATPGGSEHNVVALNKKTGALVWSSPGKGDQSAYCSPLFIGSQQVPLIVTMTAHHVLGIHAETGRMLWAHPNSNQHHVHANTPVYSNGMILVTSGYGRGSTMLRLTNGGRGVEEVWFSSNLDNRMGGMVKVGNYIFGSGDRNRFWFCADWRTGEIKWQERGLANGVIIANDGMLYIYTDRGDMILARATPEKFDIVSRFSITLGTDQHWAHPIIYNGVLYIRRGDTLMAYRVR
jgi:outer membrane protein assembly factor BamB